MNQDFDVMQKTKYTADGVLRRGYEIYDEWTNKKQGSRKIVSAVERAVASMHGKQSRKARAEALSHLFALDTRIKERYNNLWHGLFLYFSWRRETRALKRLRGAFPKSKEEEDIRTAIETELDELDESIETEEAEDEGDETRGGKRNGKEESEATPTEEKGQEAVNEETPEETPEPEETKETSEEKIEESEPEEQAEELGEQEEPLETPQEEETPEQEEKEEKEETLQEEQSELEEENNVPDDESEPSTDKTDKKEEAKTYNDAVDSPPLYKETASERPEKKTSFIDEMLIDNMVKGDKTIIGYQRIDEAARRKDASLSQDTATIQNEGNKSTDKNAYLYDRMTSGNQGKEAQQTEKSSQGKNPSAKETTKDTAKETTENTAKPSTNEPNKDSDPAYNRQEEKDLRTPLQVDITQDYENNMIKEMSDTMSIESKLAYVRMQEDMLREQIRISNQELGIDDNVDVLKISVPEQIHQPTVTQNIK